MNAVFSRNLKMVQLLIRHGADLGSRQQSLVAEARDSENNCIFELLVVAGAES